MKVSSKVRVSVISGIAILGLLFNVPSFTAYADKEPEKSNVSNWVDLDNDGMVDKDKLSKEEREQADKRTAEIDDYLEKIASKKAKMRAEINKAESKQEKSSEIHKQKALELEEEIKDLETNMEANIGLVEVADVPLALDESGMFSIAASTSADVSLSGTIYKDIFNAGRWVVKGEWEWTNSDWGTDKSGTGDVGKLDGFGLIVDEEIDIYSYSLNTYWSYDGNRSTPGTIYNDKSEDDNGWGWKWQDKIAYDQTSLGGTVRTYNSGSGIATMSIKFEDTGTGSGDIVEVTSEYGHTYSSTDITDITFSLTDIGFSFSSTSSRWSDTGNWPKEL